MQKHLNELRSVAARVLGSRDEAEDAVQEALVTFWRLRDEPPNVRAWLVRTVLHRSLHARRTAMRRRKWESRAGEELSRSCALCAPGDELERRELLETLDSALAGLSEEHRVVLAMREIQHLDYDAISRELRVPVGTVRSRLSRARAALRAEFHAVAPESCLRQAR
ncbi:MAG: RNA polymerase sigma factor [Myxococcota bacterium]